jgi:peptidoglycan/LPS O-acetylase OafA/YrhL
MRYRADIDGLRALAVLPVVLYHARLAGLHGGFVGVDVFFVISGFLICSIIAADIARDDFSILRFYERRCRRILPALFAVFLGTSVLGALVLMPPDLAAFGRSLLSSVCFVSNIYFWKDSGYFDGAAEFKPLLQTWSLSVEEQFYVVVPYLLVAISVLFHRRYLALLIPLALGSLGVSVWAVAHAPNAAYYVMPTRFWEILLGGLIAVGAKSGSSSRVVRELLAGTGLLAILGSSFFYSDATPFPGLAALLPCGGAALIIYAGLGEVAPALSPSQGRVQPAAPALARGTTLTGRLLSTAPLTFVGKISYSLYLWHWPIFALYRYHVGRELARGEGLVLVAISVLLAIGSWRYVERPFRQHSSQPGARRLVFAGAAAGALATATFAGTAMATGGLPFRMPGFELVDTGGQRNYDAGRDGNCFLGDGQTHRDWGGEKCFVSRGQGPTVLLWGDSFAAHYVPGLMQHRAELRADILEYTLSACPPVFGFDTMSNPPCKAFNDHVPDLIREYGVQAVVVSGRWDYAVRRHVEPSQIRASLERLRGLGVRVDVIGQSPMFGNQVQTLFAQAGGTRAEPEGWGYVTFVSDLNAELAAAMPPGVHFIDPLSHLCRLPSCPYRLDGKFLMWDEGHFSDAGSAVAVAEYFPYLEHATAGATMADRGAVPSVRAAVGR